jgi:hypothetical protein
MREPTGTELKRGDDDPKRDDMGEGSGESTGRNRGFRGDERGSVVSTFRFGEGRDTSDGRRIVFAAGSGPDDIKTSFHPLCVFYDRQRQLMHS